MSEPGFPINCRAQDHLLDRDLQLRRQPNLADAVAMGQAATPEEERDVGQSSLLSADQDQGVELCRCGGARSLQAALVL